MGIDSFFDQVEDVLDAFSGAPAPPARSVARARQAAQAATTEPAAAIAERRSLAGGAAAIVAQEYRIVESIDATTGRTAWVVTNGRDRVECSSAEIAIRVRAALG